MKIIEVKINSDYYKEIIDIYYKWWGKKYFNSITEFFNYYDDIMKNDDLPYIYALINDDELVGMYEINEHDRINVSEKPFLANVFIKEEYRGNGYSKLLINDAIKVVKNMGYDYLYLRSHHENYYEKFGFVLFKEVETNLGRKRLFRIKLT